MSLHSIRTMTKTNVEFDILKLMEALSGSPVADDVNDKVLPSAVSCQICAQGTRQDTVL